MCENNWLYLVVLLSVCVMNCPGVFRLRTVCDSTKVDVDVDMPTPLLENGKKSVYTFTYLKHIFKIMCIDLYIQYQEI